MGVYERVPVAHARERRIRVRNDCDGSEDCAAEIHIEQVRPPYDHLEVHLTVAEARGLRAALGRAVEKFEHEHQEVA